ncbi:MAG: sporulation integral membrane protein YlbJ [Thermoanaerobacterales bacterium]|nr:sporulation integral membrane protein YlbJ [Thermoanaerobacterales bacterium]
MRFAGRTLFAFGALVFVSAMVLSPRTVFEGATLGLQTWWNIVFPSLLPFFIISELLLGLGVVRLLGVLLEPVMRPLFHLPGAASFAVAVGYSSGYPIGGAVTARLRAEGLVTRAEAEHLVAFTNNASPLFVLVAVAVGMFNQPAVGPFILSVHYLTNLLLGLLLRFYAPAGRSRVAFARGIWRHAWRGFLETEGCPPGQILGEAVRSSVQKLMVIGGYIIFFAVAIRLLAHYGVLGLLARLLGTALAPFGLDPGLFEPIVAGCLEMTLGTKLAAEAPVPLLHKLVAVQLILAWSGLSIQAQMAAFTAGTDIRLRLYLVSRIGHAALAALVTCLLFPLWEPVAPAAVVPAAGPHLPSWAELLWVSTAHALIQPLFLASLGLATACLRRLLHGL